MAQIGHVPSDQFAGFHGGLYLETLSSKVRVDKIAPQSAVAAALHGQYQSTDVPLS